MKKKQSIISGIIFKTLSSLWAEGKLKHIRNYLPRGGSVLDLGCGKGAVSYRLKKEGYSVTSLDVENKSLTDEVHPVIYDGSSLPFEDNAFDTVLLLTVLHHIKDPETVLREAKRTGKQIIIIEDIYTNRLQKRITFFLDSLFNGEFRGHPHSNKTDAEWKKCFEKEGLVLLNSTQRRVMLVCRQAAYNLKKK